MHEILSRNLYLVKEHVGMFKAANNYDIYAPESGQMIMECREEKLGLLTKIFRFTDYKRMTPFDIQVRTPDGRQVVRVKRGVSFFLSKVEVFDEFDRPVGFFKQKLFSIGGAFQVLNMHEQPVCQLKGKWTGWDFSFIDATGVALAQVAKKWAGLGKEMFTSADNYMLQISDAVSHNDERRELIMAAVMCIDMVLKE
ncbi:MAG TPA: phospholipid scramblase-related protein [Geobacterales bacterium]|jgi:uncharacterized protein YxjI|nr:phospholipid scramblase-related protein [Geobacterales bacterium]